MKVTQAHINRFIELTKKASYDYPQDSDLGLGTLKKEYRNLGRRILKHIAEELNLAAGSFDIRWNPGGVACSGDHTLHTDTVYLALHDNCGLGWFYWRTCKGRKDYTGGGNQIVRWETLRTHGLAPLIEDMRRYL
jgi:hypothetical protein